MKIWYWFLIALTLSMPVMSIEFKVWASSNAFVYPLDKDAEIFFTIQKDFLDSIEDIEFTVTVSGPASFSDGSKSITGELAEFKEDISGNYTLQLEHTPELKGESVVVVLSGTYVSNAYVLGGKKQFNASTLFSVISRDSQSDPEDEPSGRSSTVDSASETVLRDEINKLQEENIELKVKLATTEEKLEAKSAALNSILFWTFFIILIGAAGAYVYFYVKKKFKHKKKFKDEDY